MSHEAAHTRPALEALLANNADRIDPLRLQRIMALQRRAATQEGDLRRLLEQRLAELVNACAEELDREADAPTRTNAVEPRAVRPRPTSGLADLIGRITSRAAQGDVALGEAPLLPARSDSAVFDDLRQVCAEVRTESQLRQALTPAPADAGPLNSASLVHRALTRMRDLSPDYLEHFVAYVDALSGLEPICAKHMPATDSPSSAVGSRKASSPKSRRRPT